MGPGITAVVVNHNGLRHLERTLPRLLEEGKRFAALLLVDNGSTDGSLDLVRERFPGIRILELGRNHGAAVARNRGFAAASTERVLFLDNDVALGEGCVETLQRALDEDPQAVFAMPCVLHDDDPETVQYCGASAHCSGLMVLEHAGTPAGALPLAPRRTDSLVTACFLADRRRWGPEPLFDETFFYIFEDHELGLRARLLGHAILSVPAARVLHGRGTLGLSLRTTGRHTLPRVLHTILGRWQVVLKLYRPRTLLLLAPALLLFEVVQWAGAARRGWLGAWTEALQRLLRLLPGLLRRRRAFQARRRLPDRAVLAAGALPLTAGVQEGFAARAAARVLEAVFSFNWRLARHAV